MIEYREQDYVYDTRRQRCKYVLDELLSEYPVDPDRILERIEMSLVVLFGIVNGLDRNFRDLDPAGAFKEHLGLVFKPFTLAVDHVLHEIKRKAPKARLGITDLGA